MSQTSYTMYQANAFAGMLADISDNDILSYSAETADIPFGKALVLGTNKEKQVKQASTSAGQGALVVGFSIASHTVEQNSSGVAAYPRYSAVNTLKRGRFWMETEDAVVAGAVANFKLSSGKVTDEAVAAGIEAFTQVSVRFVTGTTGAGLAIVEVK